MVVVGVAAVEVIMVIPVLSNSIGINTRSTSSKNKADRSSNIVRMAVMTKKCGSNTEARAVNVLVVVVVVVVVLLVVVVVVVVVVVQVVAIVLRVGVRVGVGVAVVVIMRSNNKVIVPVAICINYSMPS